MRLVSSDCPLALYVTCRIVDGAPENLQHYGLSTLIHLSASSDICLGLDLARLADLPDDVLVEARRVAERLDELEERKKEESKTNKVAIRRKALLRVNFSSSNFLGFVAALLWRTEHIRLLIPYFGLGYLYQLRTQLTQAFEHSTLPDDDLATYLGRFQTDILKVLQETL